ncbi:AsnC family transcriptional regulator [Plasticicumulans lactativorans]|uniref:AsnC family transcriptional regulator n=1 Tax=Plasticicumulans lactativorans TaxID=1133106 RepID=A0A4R2L5G6_9GAMM|nr:Lrp/AsnC family transcriptional regulator [Plasticicumulans lactativorans]TCO81950.1 AsnC family transcriptional regulator [Plasticicumulans lactativorans]
MRSRLKLDRLYLRILSMLQRNARITNQELADAVGLSPSPCLERVRKLEREGYVRGYRAELDLERLGSTVTVYTLVALGSHDQARFERFEHTVASLPQIVECAKVSGSFDYLLRWVCRSVSEYHRLSDRLLAGAAGATLTSHIVLEHTRPFSGYPLEHLFEPQPDA